MRIHYLNNPEWAEVLDRYGRLEFAGRASEAEDYLREHNRRNQPRQRRDEEEEEEYDFEEYT